MTEHDAIAAAASQIVHQTQHQPDTSWCFGFTPAAGVVVELSEITNPPFATVTGGEEEMGALLRSFEGWEGTLKIGVLKDQGLLDFWVF